MADRDTKQLADQVGCPSRPITHTAIPTVEELLATYGGRPIRNCPGRYVLPASKTQCPPEQIVGEGVSRVFEHTTVKDTVVVTWIEDWGLISYHRRDGSWCHTVNEPDGFERKLTSLGIASPTD